MYNNSNNIKKLLSLATQIELASALQTRGNYRLREHETRRDALSSTRPEKNEGTARSNNIFTSCDILFLHHALTIEPLRIQTNSNSIGDFTTLVILIVSC